MRKNSRGKKTGFTLIELMVVIVIIGILGTSAFFLFQGATDDAKFNVAGGEISRLAEGVGQYQIKYGEFPSALEDLKQMGKVSGFSLNDPWKREYLYESDGDSFRIWSLGAKENDDDDDVWYTPEDGLINPHLETKGGDPR